MKAQLVMLYLGVMLTLTTYGGISYSTLANSGYIPDSRAVGSSGTATTSGYLPSISDISVKLNITGGHNGDLYAYLSYKGTLVPLLNRVGVTATSGGNAIDPQSSPGSLDSASRLSFCSFNGLNPNGTWTLFLADLSSGGVSQLVSWELDITPVPEPVNVALGIFGGVFLVVILGRSQRVRNRVQRWRVAVVQWINAV